MKRLILILAFLLIPSIAWATWPSDSVRTKNWSAGETLTDTDLEGQFDVIHTWVNDSYNSSTGHKHDGTSNESQKIELNNSNSVIGVEGTLGAANGGTGLATITDGGIMLGNGTGNVVAMSVLADGEIVVGDGTTDPVALGAFTSSTGDLKHESGGLEFDASAVTKGDIITSTAAGAMSLLNVGSNGQALVADSSASEGVKWDTTFQLKSVTALSGTNSGDITIEASKHYLVVFDFTTSTSAVLSLRFNSNSTAAGYEYVNQVLTFAASPTETLSGSAGNTLINLSDSTLDTTGWATGSFYIDTFKKQSKSAFIHGEFISLVSGAREESRFSGFVDQNLTITDFEIFGPNMTGNVYLYELDLAT